LGGKAEVVETVYKTITDSGYNGNLFDAFILAELYGINIVILKKRRKKGESDHVLITPVSKKIDEYILVFKSNYNNKNVFESVVHRDKSGFQFVFVN